MALNPVERLNVFPPELRAKLRERSYSNNLVQTRTPFLRFTTAATMSDLSNKLNIPNKSKFKDYDGYEFFTLGVHGYDKIDYSATDLYGTQSSEGLVVGTTYKQGEQKLVRTFGGLRTDEKAKSYPPPGILSAKVERLRNGNVLRFTVETQCYTQEQLEMLDAVCFVPGMTCVLEWGTQYTTQNETKPLRNILNFKNVQSAKNAIIDAGLESRKTFIGKWCAETRGAASAFTRKSGISARSLFRKMSRCPAMRPESSRPSMAAIRQASPKPTTKGAGSVPDLRPLSCPPPENSGARRMRGRRRT